MRAIIEPERNIGTSDFIEFTDFRGNTIVLTNDYYKHIIKQRGASFTMYHHSWVDTLKKPDYIGNGKQHKDCRIYIQENNKHRNFPSRYIVVVVNENNLITSIRFGSNLNFINNLEKIEHE